MDSRPLGARILDGPLACASYSWLQLLSVPLAPEALFCSRLRMKEPHMGEPWGYITGEGGQASTGGHEPGPDQAYTESGGRGRGPFSVTLETSAGSGVQNFLQEPGLSIVTSKASWPL